jgi:aspartate beta-hydroxylase
LAREQAAPLIQLLTTGGDAGVDLAIAAGGLSAAETALLSASAQLGLNRCIEAVEQRYSLVELGQALLMTGNAEAAASVLAVACASAPPRRLGEPPAPAPPPRVPPAGSVSLGSSSAHRSEEARLASLSWAGRFAREAAQYHALALEAAGRPDAAAEATTAAVRRGVWLDRLQRPLDHLDPSLCRRAFWDAAKLPAARALEAAFPAILAELQALLGHAGREAGDSTALAELQPLLRHTGHGAGDSPASSGGCAGTRRSEAVGSGGASTFSLYASRVVAAGAWSDVQLYAGCRRDEEHCRACPLTSSVLASRPEFNSVVFGSHFHSRLAPGTRLSAHCGPSNFRLRCHLGLVVPDGCRIRVGSETRAWRAGECLVFDDSFEHEVWHDGDSDRIVLIADMWHPQLRVDATVEPLLNDEQRAALEAARFGSHLPLLKRVYSTGKTVPRTREN